jgi:hypothetical protein
MGFFSEIKNNFRKAESAAVIESLLEKQLGLGFLSGENVTPAEMANNLIQVVWDRNPGISRAGTLPHKMTLAAVGLSNGIIAMSKSGSREILLALNFCLGQILLEINASGDRMKLHALDFHLIDEAQNVYISFANNDLLG